MKNKPNMNKINVKIDPKSIRGPPNIMNNKDRTKIKGELFPRIRANQRINQKYNFLVNQNRSQEIIYNKNYNFNPRNRSARLVKSARRANSSENMGINGSVNRINSVSSRRINNSNIKQRSNIMIDINNDNNSYIFNKRNRYNNNINRNIMRNKYDFINRSEERQLRIQSPFGRNQKRNNFNFQNYQFNNNPKNRAFPRPFPNNKNNPFFNNNNIINNNNRYYLNKKMIKLPMIFSSPSQRNRSASKKNQRIKTFTLNYQMKNRAVLKKNNALPKNPGDMKGIAIKRLNHNREKPRTFQNDSKSKDNKKKILIKQDINFSSNRNMMKKNNNIRNAFFGNNRENRLNIKNNLLQNPKYKINKSQSFIEKNDINNNMNRNSHNNRLINSNKRLFLNHNNFMNNPGFNYYNNTNDNVNKYYMNNIRQSYNNNNPYNGMNNYNNMNHMNPFYNNNKMNGRNGNVVFNRPKINNLRIKDYANNFEPIQRNINNFNEKNQNNFYDNIRSHTSFDNQPLMLPNIPNNMDYGKHNTNNHFIDENKDNDLEILMNQRLNFQSNMPNDSRFKIKLQKYENLY